MPDDTQIVFSLTRDQKGGTVLILGIPGEAWEKIKNQNTANFDLSKVGLPLKVIIYGAEDHKAAMAVIDDYNRKMNLPYMDRRNEDFGIKLAEKPPGDPLP